MLKAVIFDMDGVIIDSEPQHARAALRVLNRHGANADYDYCSSFIGSSTKVFTQDIMKRFPLSISLEDLLEEMNLEKKKILKEEMEHAASLSVPLLADMHTGKNWYEAK